MSEKNNFKNTTPHKHGRCGGLQQAKLSYNQLRFHCVSVRLNNEELDLLNEKRGQHRKGEWLRLSLLNKLPAVVPAINFEAWKTLGEISQKLNKLVAHLDSKSYESPLTQTELFAVKRQVSELRLHLITADLWRASHEGDAEDKAR